MLILLLLSLIQLCESRIYFSENFDDSDWSKRWVQSDWKAKSEVGAFAHVSGENYPDANDKAIKTSEDARFYAISAKFDHILNNIDKDLYISYFVQHEQSIDCGGAYIKLLPKDTDQTQFGGDSKYNIMFGPDVCGVTKKTHAILNYARPNEEAINMDHKTAIQADFDSKPHVFTLIIKKDNTYDVHIDGKSVQSGLLTDGWLFQPPKEIADPNVVKPSDWVDEEMMDDPSDKKPEGYDDIPKHIPDPDAVMPEDWDEEDDGEWEPPKIANPDYKGEWKPRKIKNPAYNGAWEHPLIPNPAYFQSETFYNVAKDVGVIGFELWQVKSGTIFDDILVTDDAKVFEEHEKRLTEKCNSINEHITVAQKIEDEKKEAELKTSNPKDDLLKDKEEEALDENADLKDETDEKEEIKEKEEVDEKDEL